MLKILPMRCLAHGYKYHYFTTNKKQDILSHLTLLIPYSPFPIARDVTQEEWLEFDVFERPKVLGDILSVCALRSAF
jgi:hypothetical protein